VNAAPATALAVALAGLAAACAGPAPVPPPFDLAPFTACDPAAFPGAAAVLAGFAAPDDDPAMRIGDAALLGIELHRDGTVERQLLLLEVVDLHWRVPDEVRIGGVVQPDGGGVRVRRRQGFRVTSTGVEGTGSGPQTRDHLIQPVDVRLTRTVADDRAEATAEDAAATSTVATLYEEPLAVGWWPYAAPAVDSSQPQRVDAARLHALDHAFALTMSMQALAENDPVLQALLFRVVDPPSLWSVVTSFAGIADEVRPARLELRVNDATAAWATLLVARPRDATRVCGGLVGAIVQHPSDPGRRAVVRLLATRRGAPVAK
jgi:hypothetical protein